MPYAIGSTYEREGKLPELHKETVNLIGRIQVFFEEWYQGRILRLETTTQTIYHYDLLRELEPVKETIINVEAEVANDTSRMVLRVKAVVFADDTIKIYSVSAY